MTASEWWECNDPHPMLELVGTRLTERKRRLLIVGQCRYVWDLLAECGRASVEVAERFADGLATPQALEHARWDADNNSVYEDMQHQQAQADRCLPRSSEAEDQEFLRYIEYRSDRLCAAMRAHATTFPEPTMSELVGDFQTSVLLLRDLLGNPFQHSSLDPAWLAWDGGVIPKLAQGIYDERRFEDLPVLADALEEAGCTDPDILNHCRSPETHVRGCWVVDLILGKT